MKEKFLISPPPLQNGFKEKFLTLALFQKKICVGRPSRGRFQKIFIFQKHPKQL
jgi:hypothetical protein